MRLFPCFLTVAIGLPTAGLPADEVSYNRDIRPILSDKCFHCHGPDATHREADLRLDTEASAKASVIVAHQPDRSELNARITHADPHQRMPPLDSGKVLSAAEISLLRRWISAGAPYERPWAYVRPRRTDPPQPADKTWPVNWIDHFVLARLEQQGMTPSPDADPVTLIRRLYFDLTGLPPDPNAVDDFIQDKSSGAIETVVNRLLESERFGERMAMYWLDLVRFADTVGYHGDQDHSISPYRDYVIDAFNDNMPFDRFTREQLAGDLLPNSLIDHKIASAYNRLLQTSHEGGVQPREYLAIYAADRVRNLSAVWMGATMGCCQCHDHKYDPYTSRDFYSMAAFFADIDELQHFTNASNTLPTKRPPEIQVLTRREREQIAALDRKLRNLANASVSLGTNEQNQLVAMKRQRDEIRKNARATMITVSITPRTMRVLPRGNWLDDSGPIVEPAVPEFLGRLDLGRRATRLDLAQWLTDAHNGAGGLTARVFANRFWYLLLGSGISRDLDDFGGQGEPPYYPHLLDNLAVEFVNSRWDVKHMMRLIVMSRTYRQSSLEPAELRRRDPYNRLYARQSRFRLPAEMVRDNALSISGLLVLDYGGASVKPWQPFGYYQHLNFPKRVYTPHRDQRQWRRGVYVHWQRQFLHPMLKSLDAPTREECTAQRPRSNSPTAALTLLNDPTFVEAARMLAARIVAKDSDDSRERLDFAFHLAVSRPADKFEHETLMQLLETARGHYRSNPEAVAELFNVGLARVPEHLNRLEVAIWTTVARAILNLNEVITRN